MNLNPPISKLVISTVGASLLLNGADTELRKRLNKLANHSQLTGDDVQLIQQRAEHAAQLLASATVAEIRRASAELNGIFALYNGQLSAAQRDTHILIGTDTALGRTCTTLVKNYLTARGVETREEIIKGLSAASTTAFQEGCRVLTDWCVQTLPPYREQRSEIVFNLVAAFKPLQGYLNTIGMLYADRMLFIFEGRDEPIFIPRLPMRVDTESLRKYGLPLTLMAEADAIVPLEALSGMPEALYEQVDGLGCGISNWGKLIWGQLSDELLSGELLPFPRLTYKQTFVSDYQRTKVMSERVRMQKILARVVVCLDEANGDTSSLKGGTRGGILYDNYTGKGDKGAPIGHFRISDGLRVSCQSIDGQLVMRHFGPHDYVNNNP